MGSEVVEDAAAARNADVASPGGLVERRGAIKVCVEFENVAKGSLSDEVLDGQKVRVPPAVLVYADETVVGSGDLGKLVGLSRSRHEWFLGQNVLAGLQGGLCEFKVAVCGSCDDNDIDLGVGEELLVVCVVLDAGVVFRRRVAGLGCSLNDS